MDVLAAAGPIAAAILAVVVWWASERRQKYETLSKLMTAYASPEMLSAIAGLWEFYEIAGDKFIENAERDLSGKELDRPLNDKPTLNSRRRMVDHFYTQLAHLYFAGMLPGKRVFEVWKPKDLRVITRILIPLGNVLGRLIPRTIIHPNYQPDDVLNRFVDEAERVTGHRIRPEGTDPPPAPAHSP